RTGPFRFCPPIVTSVPPAGGPNAGEMPVIEVTTGGQSGGHVVVGIGLNVTDVVFRTLLTTACTTAVPAADEVSVTVATPFVVVRRAVFVPVSVKVPKSVENSTAVPFGTGLPFVVAVAEMMVVVLTWGFADDAVSVSEELTGGGVVPPPDGGGAVGDSCLPPVKRNRRSHNRSRAGNASLPRHSLRPVSGRRSRHSHPFSRQVCSSPDRGRRSAAAVRQTVPASPHRSRRRRTWRARSRRRSR